MKTNLILFILLFFSFHSISQKYSQGIIVTTKGDTIKSLIKDRKSSSSSKEIIYKKTLNQSKETINPENVKVVIRDNLKYVSAFISEDPFNNYILLEELVNGPVDLYRAYDSSKNLFFILKNTQDEYILLKEKNYFGLLKYHLRECSSINFDHVNTLINTQYSAADLSKMVLKYNKCIHPEIKSEYHINKQKIDVGILLGVSQNTMIVDDEDLPSDNYGTSTSFSPGIYFDVHLNKSLSILIEINYYQYKGEYLYKPFTEYPLHARRLDYSEKQLKAPLQLKYAFRGKVKPFINAGVNVNYRINQKVLKYYNNNSVENIQFDFRKVSIGFTGGAGIIFPLTSKTEFRLEGKYNYSSLSIRAFSAGSVHSYEIFLGVGF